MYAPYPQSRPQSLGATRKASGRYLQGLQPFFESFSLDRRQAHVQRWNTRTSKGISAGWLQASSYAAHGSLSRVCPQSYPQAIPSIYRPSATLIKLLTNAARACQKSTDQKTLNPLKTTNYKASSQILPRYPQPIPQQTGTSQNCDKTTVCSGFMSHPAKFSIAFSTISFSYCG